MLLFPSGRNRLGSKPMGVQVVRVCGHLVLKKKSGLQEGGRVGVKKRKQRGKERSGGCLEQYNLFDQGKKQRG